MLRKRISLLLILLPFVSLSQLDFLDLTVKKSGPYFGYQRGKYDVFEIGAERQWKKVELTKATSQAINAGFNYNFRYNSLGFDIGYWNKPSRVGLTYGARVVLRTDFTETRVGLAPCIGYKLFGFHLQTGYHFLTEASSFNETNHFFIGLRFVLINDRDMDLEKGSIFKKKKKN